MMVLAESGGTQPLLLDWLEGLGSTPWLLLFALGIATFVSEDLACISAGILAAKGVVDFASGVAACAVGIWIGDVGLYAMGYVVGHKRRHWRWLDRIVTTQRVAKGRRFFESYGIGWIFMSRFLPGMRLPSYIAAGAVGWSFRKFVLALALGAWIWTPILCGLAYSAGRAVLEWLEVYQRWAWPVLIGVVLLIWGAVQLLVPLLSWQGRRLLLGRLRRLRRWEFWPVWAVYPPVVASLAWQALRLRGAALFSCSNPAIPHSGFALESKGDILDSLDPVDESVVRIASYVRLDAGAASESRLAAIRDFMQTGGFGFPIVLKPDVGERGQGVAITHDETETRRWLAAYHGPAIAQEFVDGPEFGISWWRRPGEVQGSVSSVAGKHPRFLEGDGKKTVERLILEDSRASAMASYFLVKFESQLQRIPRAGERLFLTRIGTHARGAVFTDERHLITEELCAALDDLADRYEGFQIGRYDVRVESQGNLRSARGLVVLELNGVTGEPLHIYHPRYPWWRGVRDLCAHWRTACEIGAETRRHGAAPSSLRSLWTLIRMHRKHDWFEADDLIKEAEIE